MKIHPAAAALSLWTVSIQGRQCADGPAEGEYLRNRLATAFLAGWQAAEDRAITRAEIRANQLARDLFGAS